MKKIIIFSLLLLGLSETINAQVTTITSIGPTTTCANGAAGFNVVFDCAGNTIYDRVTYIYYIYKNGTNIQPSGEILKGYNTNLDQNFIAGIGYQSGSGNYSIMVISRGYRDDGTLNGIQIWALEHSQGDESNAITISFTSPPVISFAINGLPGQYITPCYTEPIIVTYFNASCQTGNAVFYSIMETNGAWGPIIGTEKMQWLNYSPYNFDVKAWSASQGLTLQEGHYYTFKLAIGNPFTAYAISMYIKPTAPGLYVNGVEVTGASYPSQVHNVCSSSLNTAFNAWSSTCEGNYFIEVSECRWNLVKTGKHEWNLWFNSGPGVENVGVIPLGTYTAAFSIPTSPTSNVNALGGTAICIPYSSSGFQMNGGNLPGSSDERFWRVTIATGETGWKTVTALVKINDGCLTLGNFETEQDGNHGISNYHMQESEYQEALDMSEATVEDLLKFIKPVEGAVYPKYVLDIDKQQNEIPFETKIYPNPANSFFSVDLEMFKQEEVKIDLLDINGQIVKSVLKSQLLENTRYVYPVQTEGLSKGVYLLRIATSSTVTTQKVVIE